MKRMYELLSQKQLKRKEDKTRRDEQCAKELEDMTSRADSKEVQLQAASCMISLMIMRDQSYLILVKLVVGLGTFEGCRRQNTGPWFR